MSDHEVKERVRIELDELQIKISNLKVFIAHGLRYQKLDAIDQTLLVDQLGYMEAYKTTLVLRWDRMV